MPQIKTVQIESLHHPYQDLIDCMRQDGFSEAYPILVYKDNSSYIIVDGKKRFMAALSIGLTTIPIVEVSQKEAEESKKLIALFELNQSVPKPINKTVEHLKKFKEYLDGR